MENSGENNLGLLVLTASEATWGSSQSIVFIGEWCKKYGEDSRYAERRCETMPFHWNDREKLARDYDYLKGLHHLLLAELAVSLNRVHGVDFSVRYWQILLDPWLMSYIGVLFDRWESVDAVFIKHRRLNVLFQNSKVSCLAPASYEEFIGQAAYSDNWNQDLYERIISHSFQQFCNIETIYPPEAVNGGTPENDKVSLLSKVVQIGRRVLIPFQKSVLQVFKSSPVIFVGSSMSVYMLARLGFYLRFMPLYVPFHGYSKIFGDGVSGETQCEGNSRNRLEVEFATNSEFERFLCDVLVADIPRCLVEDFDGLRKRVQKVFVAPKLIVTCTSLWHDSYAKAWFAEHVNSGGKLLVTEHGGSLPPFRELFDFEADSSDLRASWFLPYHSKHVQLPALKVIKRTTSPLLFARKMMNRRRYCSVIGNECARWVHRAHFYPMADQWSSSFEMIGTFHNHLDKSVQKHFRVKPYHSSQGWNTKSRYVDLLGEAKVYKVGSLDKVFAMSRVIVCSYPETTFSEAMATGTPTLLVYPEHLYELNPVAGPLMRILREAKIVFNDPLEAARHLNEIWEDPSQWWESDRVCVARKEFLKQALCLDDGWVAKWGGLLETLSD